jgi:hypothetical protein
MSADGLDRKVWVMTLNRAYDEVTFWDVKQHKNYILKGRVRRNEVQFLEAYLSPDISKE